MLPWNPLHLSSPIMYPCLLEQVEVGDTPNSLHHCGADTMARDSLLDQVGAAGRVFGD